jgi:hypothetical protein
VISANQDIKVSSSLSKLYTYSIPIILVLNGYSSGIPGLSIGGILMNLYNLCAIIKFSRKKKIDGFGIRTTLLFLFFINESLISFAYYGIVNLSEVLKEFLKMATWLFGITITAKYCFDYHIFKAWYRKFCLFCTFFLFFQAISWNFLGFYLPNLFNFGFLVPLYEQYSATSYINYFSAISFGRFSSLFAEPAYYGILMVLDLIIVIFNSNSARLSTKHNRIEIFIIIMGIWLSTSTAAIIFVVFIIGVYMITSKNVDKYYILILILSILFFLFFVFENSMLLSFFVEKITTLASSGRVGWSYSRLNDLSSWQFLFGVGMGNFGVVYDSSYFNQVTGLIIEFGLLGVICFFIYLVVFFFKRKTLSLFVLLVVYIAAMAQGGYLFNLYGILFFSVAQYIKPEKKKRLVQYFEGKDATKKYS